MKQKQLRENTHEAATVLTTLELLGVELGAFNNILDRLPITLWMHDENHKIIFGNDRFKETFGAFQKQTCHQCLMGKENVCSCCPSKRTPNTKNPDQCKLCKRGNSGYDLNVFHSTITDKNGQNFFLKSSFHIKDFATYTKNHSSGLEYMNGEKKILVMCASCKKARDKQNNWVNVDKDIIDSFNVRISHSICSTCQEILYSTLNMQEQQVNITAE